MAEQDGGQFGASWGNSLSFEPSLAFLGPRVPELARVANSASSFPGGGSN